MQPERSCPQCAYATTLDVPALCPVCNVPLVARERTWAPTRRRAPRTPLAPFLTGRMDDRFEATVLDLSPLGARLEHSDLLRSGWRYVLTLPLHEDAPSFSLSVRVVWTRVHRSGMGRGQVGVIYHSGVEFQEIPAEVGREVAAFLDGRRTRRSAPLIAMVTSPRD